MLSKEDFYKSIKILDVKDFESFHESVSDLISSIENRFASGYLTCAMEHDSWGTPEGTKINILKTSGYKIWESK